MDSPNTPAPIFPPELIHLGRLFALSMINFALDYAFFQIHDNLIEGQPGGLALLQILRALLFAVVNIFLIWRKPDSVRACMAYMLVVGGINAAFSLLTLKKYYKWFSILIFAFWLGAVVIVFFRGYISQRLVISVGK